MTIVCVCMKWLLNDDGLPSKWDFSKENNIKIQKNEQKLKKRTKNLKKRSYFGCYLFNGFICSMKCWKHSKLTAFITIYVLVYTEIFTSPWILKYTMYMLLLIFYSTRINVFRFASWWVLQTWASYSQWMNEWKRNHQEREGESERKLTC